MARNDFYCVFRFQNDTVFGAHLNVARKERRILIRVILRHNGKSLQIQIRFFIFQILFLFGFALFDVVAVAREQSDTLCRRFVVVLRVRFDVARGGQFDLVDDGQSFVVALLFPFGLFGIKTYFGISRIGGVVARLFIAQDLRLLIESVLLFFFGRERLFLRRQIAHQIMRRPFNPDDDLFAHARKTVHTV